MEFLAIDESSSNPSDSNHLRGPTDFVGNGMRNVPDSTQLIQTSTNPSITDIRISRKVRQRRMPHLIQDDKKIPFIQKSIQKENKTVKLSFSLIERKIG